MLSTHQKIGYAILCVSVAVLLYGFIFTMTSSKRVVGYYLSGYDSKMSIGVDIENCMDSNIPLIGIPYDSAVTLVNRLNAERNDGH